jgi:hypothetical protein
MILLSLNCSGLANASQKLAINRLVETHKPSILFIQKTILEGDRAIKSLSQDLPTWKFFASNALGRFGGIFSKWKKDTLLKVIGISLQV